MTTAATLLAGLGIASATVLAIAVCKKVDDLIRANLQKRYITGTLRMISLDQLDDAGRQRKPQLEVASVAVRAPKALLEHNAICA